MIIQGKSLLVFGSRTLDDDRVEKEISNFLIGKDYKYIVTALDPVGVCDRVKHYCKSSRTGVVLIEFSLDAKRSAGAHESRSIEALKIADHMLALWDGTSRGTAGEIRMAKKMGVPTTAVKIEPLVIASLDDVDFYLDEIEDGNE